jgi:4-diphosphocytidyl-2-C-methyl-D-erythritol kinase
MAPITELAYAKLNLSLRVIGKKGGRHLLQLFNIPLNLYDTLTFEISPEDQLIRNYEAEPDKIKITLDKFREKYGITEKVKITVHKVIPIGGGLGGESADSSATLRGLNRLFNLGLSLDELVPLAKELGSDNLYCLYNKPMFLKGDNETFIFLDKLKIIKNICLIEPKIQVSTKEVFTHYPYRKPKKDKLLSWYLAHDEQRFLHKIANDLTKTTVKLYPQLKPYTKIKGAQMTGSGSCFFLINPTQKQLNHLTKKQYSYRVIGA